ncbi:MAG: hypothetical protein CL678_12165 [Bdellovibrionaceae bacterium]|nr:hypothetical protein [Pseudobdellovibrionaceae bacterium]|tara:strand:- start:382 stop:726 length:345 start_codon:yes stop_codon:yes gene_type:complete
MKTLPFLLILISATTFGKQVVKIDVGKDYRSYKNSELRKRIWNLEQAVWQLQQKVFELENKKEETHAWICTIDAMGDSFSATGTTRVEAESKAIEKCTEKRQNGFFCKHPQCKQ